MTTGPEWLSSNRLSVASALLASLAFNKNPQALHIAGVRDTHDALFAQIAHSGTMLEAAQLFERYMTDVFGLGGLSGTVGVRRYRPSYLRLLKGWGFDSNSPEGAVLKGWVESRFGLLPRFHKEALERFGSPAWSTYMEEKMSRRFHDYRIGLQLDLLYEFCQWALARWFCPGHRHLTLYRGANDFCDYQVVHQANGRSAVVQLNNLVSFTADRHIACEFGDYIIEAQVPKVKILFFKDLLSNHPLKGEAEYLVVGGEYHVKIAYL